MSYNKTVSTINQPDVFLFDDYRRYLKEWFAWQKQRLPDYSYRAFSLAAGFKSPNQLLLVIQGKRNITRSSLRHFCQALALNAKEKKYFSKLIHFNQSKDMGMKKRSWQALSGEWLKNKNYLSKEQYFYLNNWYYTAIREMVMLKNFEENGDWIAKRLGHKVTPRQAMKAIRVMQKLNLLTRDKNKKLVQTNHYVSTGNEVQDLSAFLYHEQMIGLAEKSLKATKDTERHISALSFTMSKNDYESIVSEINGFRKKLVTLLTERKIQDQDDQLYQLNLQLFPLTRSPV